MILLDDEMQIDEVSELLPKRFDHEAAEAS